MIKKIGITGNIGSGKSTVSLFFKLLEIPVFDADYEARKFLNIPHVINQLVAIVGNDVLEKNGQINRKKLAKILFSEQTKLDAVNQLIHPLVMADYQNWHHQKAGVPFTLFESAIIFEHHLESYFDEIIEVVCPTEMAISRAAIRDSQTEEAIKARLAHQENFNIRKKTANFIITNDNKHSIIAQSLSVMNKLNYLSPLVK